MNTPTLPELPVERSVAEIMNFADEYAMAKGAADIEHISGNLSKFVHHEATEKAARASLAEAIKNGLHAYARAALSSALPQPDSGHQTERSADTPAPEPRNDSGHLT